MRVNGGGSAMKHLLIGAVAGLAGAWAMNQFQAAWLASTGKNGSRKPASTNPQTDLEVMQVIASRAASRLRRELSDGQRDAAAILLHYGFGASTGALYATLAKKEDWLTSGFGSVFGTVFFAAGYAVAPQDLKPCVPPDEQPKAISAVYEWLTHVLYGITVEAVRRTAVRAAR